MDTYNNDTTENKKTYKIEAISTAVILRDYMDGLEYIDEKHRRLVDIADSLWHAGIPVEEWGDNPEYNYKELYYSMPEYFWSYVLKDIHAIKTQLDSTDRQQVWDLMEEYKELLKEGRA